MRSVNYVLRTHDLSIADGAMRGVTRHVNNGVSIRTGGRGGATGLREQ
ncbi:MAG TPA: hypothetical protein VIH71_05755 [Solirubrobacteraceae bacterium]